ncbi:hypothetical protein ACFY4C_12340 [Actinomadura viridis]|uniref:hypothetical protein n=1 Tax=Actinomadura viridis TaxID=58110 RepID=UPI0036BB4419
MDGLEPAGTLHGQLQRGRGLGARRALSEPGAGELVYDCIRRDPRTDHQTEARAWYLTRLAVDLELPVGPIAEHLLAPVDAAEDDEYRVDLGIDVLVGMVGYGRGDALGPLRRYVAEGRYWKWALEAMWESGGPDLCRGLERVVVARADDGELRDAVEPDWGPWAVWSSAEPRIRAALRSCREGRVSPAGSARVDLRAVSGARLVSMARGSYWAAWAELGRRGDLSVLDLAEDRGVRTAYGALPGLGRALRGLGAAAVPWARVWVAGDDAVLAEHGVEVLAEHGDRCDVPVLMEALTRAVRAGEWCGTEAPARGLGRLGVSEAAPVLRDLWARVPHSYARADILAGLCGAVPGRAGEYAGEGLSDCEPRVRVLACGSARGPEALSRIRARRDDPLEEDQVRAAASERLGARRRG